AVAPAYRYLFNGLQQNGYLDTWRVHDYGYLLALDGTQHFASSHIHCEQCLTKTHHNGTVTYSHQVLTP
ncbi:ISNCY family transposase, partial [Thiothrix subterranea]|nr:ISNCY family transposase [Thiothrix subterranea]